MTILAPGGSAVNVENPHIDGLPAQFAALPVDALIALHRVIGTELAKKMSHDDDNHDDHHQSSTNSSSSKSDPLEALVAIGVLPPIARRLAEQYPADYLHAWCDYVLAHRDEIARPGGYLYRCITAGGWPPDPPPVVQVGPKPQPVHNAPQRPSKPSPGVNQPSAAESQQRLSESHRAAQIRAYREGLSEGQYQPLREEASRRIDLADVSPNLHRAMIAAAVNDVIAERLGLPVTSTAQEGR